MKVRSQMPTLPQLVNAWQDTRQVKSQNPSGALPVPEVVPAPSAVKSQKSGS
jgi:hypothetical protein